jgi:hypothetical protein
MAYTSSPFTGAEIDFSALAGIGQNIGQGYQRRKLADEMQGAISPDGTYDYNKMISIIAGRDPILGAKLATENEQAQVLAGYRNESLKPDSIREYEAIYGPIKVGSGNPTAGTPSGAPSPAEYAAARKVKPREFNVSDTDKLTEQAGMANQLGGLIQTFKPEFGGYTIPAQLDMAKKGLPTLNDTDKEASDWWDSYNQWVEPVRKGLYGAVLTGPDRAAFEAARITPKTDPDLIPGNLRKQHDIMTKAIQRKAETLKASNYDPTAVDAALALDPVDPAKDQARLTPEVSPPVVGGPETPALQAEVAKGGYGKQPMIPAPAKIDLLRQHANNPEARAAFDEIYGRGAAEFYLTRSR